MLANKGTGVAIAGVAAAGLAAASLYNSTRVTEEEKVAKSGRDQRSPLAQASAAVHPGSQKLPELSTHRRS
ncbi:hypothetical protein EV122DRAFT_262981 [Schizophyllum commune]